MKHSYEQIQREVRRRTRKYRRRYEQVTLTILSMLCLILSGSMLPLLSRAGMASSTVPGGYSSVLLAQRRERLCRCRHSRLCHRMHRHRPVPVSGKSAGQSGINRPALACAFCSACIDSSIFFCCIMSRQLIQIYFSRSDPAKIVQNGLIQLDLDHLLSLFLIEYKDIALRMRI